MYVRIYAYACVCTASCISSALSCVCAARICVCVSLCIYACLYAYVRTCVSRCLHSSSRTIYLFQVRAKEINTIDKYEDFARILVHVLDINDNLPAFSKDIYRYTIKDTQQQGRPIHLVC